MYRVSKYISLAILFIGSLVAVSACSDKSLDELNVGEGVFGEDVYSLNLMVTLDNLGGVSTRGISDTDPAVVRDNENYINLERFRILFFDKNDMFLFESKNRWVKQIDTNDAYSGWFVSVPFGAFGDDSYGEGKEYNWDDIRTKLTSEPFKVAILANRPAQLLYPGNFADSELKLPGGVFDNDGPYWKPEDAGKKSVFDLHHYQYDIIYADKGEHSAGATKSYYDFVMGDINTDRPTMGSAINWVSFDNDDTDKVSLYGTSVYMRHIKRPGKDHPIPMYGIQEFAPIPADKWKPGTPFDLSNLPQDVYPDKPYSTNTVSLLRSCVRLDLLIPKSVKSGAKLSHISLWYSNIYSRTEPMDTWTPTNEIWKEDHDNDCEWLNILNYGPVASDKFGPTRVDGKDAYQRRISWYYGVWKEKGWGFKTRENKTVTPPAVGSKDGNTAVTPPYPHIFNTCIQRNKVITCERGYVPEYNDGYHHYVVYTGERNINDINKLGELSAKNAYIACFVISWDNKQYYCIPLLNYKENKDSDYRGSNPTANNSPVFGPHTGNMTNDGNWPTAMSTYMNTLPSDPTPNNMPYPLLRNHIYRFTLTNTRAGGDDNDDLGGIAISSEVLQSQDIDFSTQVRMLPESALPVQHAKKATAEAAQLSAK